MFIRLHVIHYRDTKEVIEEEYFNTDYIVKFSAVNNSDSLANAYVFIKDNPQWNLVKVLETPEEVYNRIAFKGAL